MMWKLRAHGQRHGQGIIFFYIKITIGEFCFSPPQKTLKAWADAQTSIWTVPFAHVPVQCSQFFTVHGKYRNRVILFVSCLVTGKNIGQYRQILQTLKLKIRQLTGHRWRPVRVICDFDQSLITAIQTDLPRVHLSGCYFHFTKALWSKAFQTEWTPQEMHQKSYG